MSYGVGHRGSSDPKLLRLWHKPAAIAVIRPLALELPRAAGVALKREKKKKGGVRAYGLSGCGLLVPRSAESVVSRARIGPE